MSHESAIPKYHMRDAAPELTQNCPGVTLILENHSYKLHLGQPTVW